MIEMAKAMIAAEHGAMPETDDVNVDDTYLESKGAEANSAGVDSIDAESLKDDLDAVVVQVSYHIAVCICYS
jgi:hypothetical protein